MVRLRELPRTAVFAWWPGVGAPLLITGTRTGAVGEDFSNETEVELWDLELDRLDADPELKPTGSLATDSGFNDIAWGEPNEAYPLGVIAGALENGSVDLWDAEKLRKGSQAAHISRTTKHSGAVKALQFNPYRHNLLASVGAKGEIFIYDLNNMSNPFRLGASAARADDIECLDWNKQEKTAHILATGSSGGFVTVWDVKQKRDILTLNNQGRKAVSAVAWDPEESTKLATATSNDQDPAIFLWSLRNSTAPERTLKGHELGALSLSWCQQDPELLLSCGKDNRTICWNQRTGEMYGDYAAGSNWAFQTSWNPHNPSLIASASFDNKILITTIQSTNSKPDDQAAANQSLDGEDFFAKAQKQPQAITFTLPKAPKWAARPSSVSFGFGGKLVRVIGDGKKSKVSVETFAVDSSIGHASAKFEEKLRDGDLASICAAKIENARTEGEKADWQVIETLNAGKSRKKLRESLGFSDHANDELAAQTEKLSIAGDASSDMEKPATNGAKDDGFFGVDEDGDGFLADLAATKGAKTNNPFSIYTGEESEADKGIAHALMLGHFEAALDICLKEDRMSDAFMIAVCGGQKCIDKAQAAYLKKKAKGPNYLRLLASIVGKNLWDVVHNADLQNWKEVMATLCTYADETQFSDLCEALGDRLEEAFQSGDSSILRRDASFCYLAGSKLEKVVNNWVQELHEQEKSDLGQSEGDNDFAVHAKALQGFVEKVSVFRQVTNFQDADVTATADFKLAPLYSLYLEYADILTSHGQLSSAERYLDMLPAKFEGAESAQQRIRQSTRMTAPAAQRQPAAHQRAATRTQAMQPSGPAAVASPYAPAAPLINQATNATPSQYTPANATPTPAARGLYAPPTQNYAPAGYQPPSQPSQYAPSGYSGYQPSQHQAPLAPPPRAVTSSPSIAPPSTQKTGDWNDMPANFFKERQPTPRRGTPGPQPVASPFPNAQPPLISPPPPGVASYTQQKPTTPLPPPPKAGEAPPRMTSPPSGPPQMQSQSDSRAASAYAPAQPTLSPPGSTLPTPSAPPVPRGASPYQPPPSTSHAAPSNRYAPAPGSQPSAAPGGMPPPGIRNVAPNPYAAQGQSPYASTQPPPPYTAQHQQQTPYGQPPPQQAPPAQRAGPPPQAFSRGAQTAGTASLPPQGPPRTGPPPSSQPANQTASDSHPSTAHSQRSATPAKPKHPRGDRSHIPPAAQPILDLLSPEVARIKSMAPQAFKAQVDDMEKRINILFDHLNNEDLLKEDTVQQMVGIAQAVSSKEWDRAQALFTEVQSAKLETEGTHWMVGVKRLIAIGRATKA